MIASVQYNDLRGTAAADIADEYMNSLQKYLIDTYDKYNSERYVCRGCTMYVGGQRKVPTVSLNFLCWDKTAEKFVRFSPHNLMSLNDAFALFKRFEVVIGIDVNDIEVDGDDYLDLM